MRPPSLYLFQANNLLKVYLQAVKYYKARKNCNQFYIAKKIQEDFEMCDDMTRAHPQLTRDELKRLAEKYNLLEHEVSNLSVYICRTTPAAIVQMCKRIKKQVQN